MKRRILLLTAVVMIAVMLSGCALWPFGKVTVTVETPEEVTLTGEEFDDDAFEAKKNGRQSLWKQDIMLRVWVNWCGPQMMQKSRS